MQLKNNMRISSLPFPSITLVSTTYVKIKQYAKSIMFMDTDFFVYFERAYLSVDDTELTADLYLPKFDSAYQRAQITPLRLPTIRRDGTSH